MPDFGEIVIYLFLFNYFLFFFLRVTQYPNCFYISHALLVGLKNRHSQ